MKYVSDRVEDYKPRSLEERIKLAREHAKIHGGLDQSIWPYQRFSMSVGELLAAAERGLNK